ncbi:catechol 2,3-dioxygenase-like lactoylglutathione lyase family enzyme [Actinoplanes italicus]|uniref:Catechol 2,3-dioxygenase-like lactoylglutathione lyase family enzyme n=1 Tax=Actinoplanes italicus TaxID=113567 RepID=A0A2T0JWY8_9ACTN|nr:catechol 2,3-dioxygenase-like lactoylglutathione lyase family enzyme [Actinoplanes italicus]
MIRVKLTSVWVDDQAKALAFYTGKLGFIKKTDVPTGDARWLTVVSPADPDGVELLLEPAGHPATKPLKDALVADGIPFTQFAVDDVHAEVERLKGLGVVFTQDPIDYGPVVTAVLDDTCGNLIQLAAMK